MLAFSSLLLAFTPVHENCCGIPPSVVSMVGLNESFDMSVENRYTIFWSLIEALAAVALSSFLVS